MKVQITKKEFHDALIYAAVRKAGMQYPVKHSVHFHGVMTLIGPEDGDDMVCFTVELEHLPNVVPIGVPHRSPPNEVPAVLKRKKKEKDPPKCRLCGRVMWWVSYEGLRAGHWWCPC